MRSSRQSGSRRALQALIVTLLGLAGCATLLWAGRSAPPDPFFAGIQQRSVLRVGMDPTYPPFDTLINRQPAGYDADLAAVLAADLGVRLEIKTFALDTLYDSLELGRTDLLISALPLIPERQADVRYSTPYYQAGQVIVVRADEKQIAARAGLAGKTVGVELGSEADTQARRLVRGDLSTMNLVSTFSSPADAFAALRNKSLDAVITDNASVQGYAQKHADAVTIIAPPLTNEPYVIAMPAGATQLAGLIDATLAHLRESGRLSTLMGETSRP